MLERTISDFFKENNWKWKLKGGKEVVPSDEDVEKALDEAARILYNEKIGSRLTVGRLIIERQTNDYDVYLLIGSYQ